MNDIFHFITVKFHHHVLEETNLDNKNSYNYYSNFSIFNYFHILITFGGIFSMKTAVNCPESINKAPEICLCK